MASPAAALLLGSPAGSATAPPVEAGTGGRSPFRDFSRPGLPHTRNGFARKKGRSRAHNPPARGGRLFNWGLSSKAPKPPLDRLRAGCKPHKPTPQPTLTSSPKTSAFQTEKNSFL
ncbi:hypothetical protein [Mucilaginibacter glaciei]|uniref:Uncharacterized protein n=1 Tax=Mucilaginibacter glaciei TaxID=2772109 RepID=A0A926NVG0_9SPHI|nr:hypothetical protein [Mucilaginibacter glaciei]MBD1395435.1 hypothetical protein [Mucilaginibacter glaciei]